MSHILAEHAQALQTSDVTLTKMKSQCEKAEALLKAKQIECTQLNDDLENATTLVAELQGEHELLKQTHTEHLERHEEVHADKKRTQNALEAHKSELVQHKKELETHKLALDEYRRDVDAHREDLLYTSSW